VPKFYNWKGQFIFDLFKVRKDKQEKINRLMWGRGSYAKAKVIENRRLALHDGHGHRYGSILCSVDRDEDGDEYDSNGSLCQLELMTSATEYLHSVEAVRINPSGQTQKVEILKQQLANELHLPLRDFRIVDPALPKQIKATFTARPNAILFCLETIKVVVQNNEALIFNPYINEVKEFTNFLQRQLLQSNDPLKAGRFEHIVLEAALSIVCSNLFKKLRKLSPEISTILGNLHAHSRDLEVKETQVNDLLPLKNQMDELRKRVLEIKRAITEILNADEDLQLMYLPSPIMVGPTPLSTPTESPQVPFRIFELMKQNETKDDALPIPDSMPHMMDKYDNDINIQTDADHDRNGHHQHTMNGITFQISNPESINCSVCNTRENEMDINGTTVGMMSAKRIMFSSKRNQSDPIDTIQLEMMFEAYLNDVAWMSAEIEEILDEITNTEESVELQLDLLRNRMLKFELQLSILSFIATVAAAVSGLFGMNLVSHLEENPYLFWIVASLLACGCLICYKYYQRCAVKQGLL
jgi:Mg2+ and Co2+ transporter CorA